MNKTMSIREIEEKLREIDSLNHPFIRKCKTDERKGVADLLEKWRNRINKQLALKEQFMQMSVYEQDLHSQGFELVAGIDEVGRGPLAGPVVAASVILPEDFYLPGLNDSKKIPEAKREIFYDIILKESTSIGIGIIHSEEIDRLNIYQATKKAMLSAIRELEATPDYLLIDAMSLEVPMPQLSIIKGDSKSISISAASIIAKVTRDRMMKQYAEAFPQYGFENNMGYGTKEHLKALNLYGPTPWHRRSFAPVKDAGNKIE
ncbi:ribonuclease HII [Peribacillus sp. SCS-155]|uniref:ribonuclease HII n=1 Tax=Peribacillus sedimenti TaxID=3115297 RepID=UPI003905B315